MISYERVWQEAYIKDCWEYQQEKGPGIALSQIDKVLYRLDKEKGNKVIY